MLKIIILVITAIFFVSPSYGQMVVFKKGLSRLDWKMEKHYSLLDDEEQLIMSFSKAALKEDGSSAISLDDCFCTLENDTITVRIVRSHGEGGTAVILKLKKKKFESYLQHYSDIAEFEADAYFINYPTTEEHLVLEKISLNGREGLVGKVDITSTPIATWEGKVFKYSGQFQCLLYKNIVR